METTNMKNDALISVIDGQSLRLRKINNLLDPLVITYRGRPTKTAHTAIFSLDSVNDVDVTHEEQQSGHYSMTVSQITGNMDHLVAIRDI